MEGSNQYPPVYQEDEISLKELIIKVQEFIQEGLRNWLLIGLAGILFAALFVFLEYKKDTEYTAKYSFMLQEEDSKGGGGLLGLASSFGFNLGGLGAVNLDKMGKLLKSQRLLSQALLTEVEIDGKKDKLINHHVEIYELLDEWKDTKKLSQFTSFKANSLDEFTPLEGAAYTKIHKYIVEELLVVNVDIEVGIINLSFTSLNEDYSLHLTEALYDELDKFYTRKAVEPQKKALDIIQGRTDSIYNAMLNAEYRSAKFEDSERGVFLSTDRLAKQRAERDAQIYGLMYGEAVKQLEAARFSYESRKPVLQTIDIPFYPLKKTKKSYIKSVIIGGFLGGFLSLIFVFGRKIFRDIMADS